MSDLRGLAARVAMEEPAPTGRGPSVTDEAIRRLGPGGRRVAAMLRARREMGRARYGDELRAHNGRDPWVDCLQEMLDAIVYATQASIEARPMPDEAREALDALCEVIDPAEWR